MYGEIPLVSNDLFSKEPEKIVQELRRQAKEGVALSLILYPEGWARPDRLIFFRDSMSRNCILLCERGAKKRVRFGVAVSQVALAQLLMRQAAVFALGIRRLEQERGLTAKEAVLAWACWEHGYGRLEEASASEQQRIQDWAKDAWDALQRGGEVLSFVQEEVFQAPPGVSAWILSPPDEIGLRWPSAPQEVPDRTHLWEWLAVPPEEILKALAQAAARKGRVALILPGGLFARRLEFRADGLLLGFYGEGDVDPEAESWKTDNWKDNEAEVIRLLAEEKATLRRAVVRAAAFRGLVKRVGLFDAALMIALAEYGFASFYDDPLPDIPLIEKARNRHLDMLRTGKIVLERWRMASEDSGTRWDPDRADYDLARSIGLEF
jgi:hypothetical protein